MKASFTNVEHPKTYSPQVEKIQVKEQLELQKAKKLENNTKERNGIEPLQKMVEGMNDFLHVSYTNLNFELHEETNRYFVQVIEKDTEKVIREIPQKEFLDMFSKMMDYLGIVLDKRV